ncbi:hypothetical protein OIE67_36680 [Nonomuraea fuscirosea]|uniref:hypothetical protein n=1 Tax=Nonomuraea fuscirosea TaxID=1291556 RepID=UPI002DDBDBE1|nr:hypothetical protein [Nonomuraea fuscirosea]WSA49574.1 hypothetical protein OIE67_36680 [Nonomuraea fuscirosea]
MPTAQHEGLHRIFRDNPELYTRAFEMIDIKLPVPQEIAVIDTDMTEILPIDRKADTVVMFLLEQEERHIIITEAQLRESEQKVSSWAHYISYAHSEYKCPVTLMVTCADTGTATWARKAHPIGLVDHPSLVVSPIVFGPDNVKAITDPEEATENVVLTMFSAFCHVESPEVNDILKALDHALHKVDQETAEALADQTELGLGKTKAKHAWRKFMHASAYRFRSESAREHFAEVEAKGEARGEAKSILRILDKRGIPTDQAFRDKIMETTDIALLEDWIDRALDVTTAEDIFE